MNDNNNKEDLLAYMIGPKAENMEIFRSLILEALDDHMYWRRNFHPKDAPVISAADQSKEGYRKFTDNLRDLMFEFLSDAKDGIPFFSPRYVGHMNTDLLLPSLVGYFSAMLYNQNNVSDEASPVTVRLEGEVIDMLLKMVGMDPRPGPQSKDETEDKEGGWGYLCSGGTAANIYSLWVARNLRTLPIAMRLAICQNPEEDASKIISEVLFNTAKREEKTISDMTAWELLNLPTDQLYLLRAQMCKKICAELSVDRVEANTQIDKLVNPFTIQKLGDYGFRSAAANVFPNESELFTNPWRVYVSENVHYSWTKAADIIGLGQDCIVKIPHLPSFDVDVKKMEEALSEDLKRKNWTLMVASNFGTTEEGALDDLPEVRDVLDKLQKNCGTTVWWHVDAAYGGYLGTMIRYKENNGEMKVSTDAKLKRWLFECCEAIGICKNEADKLIKMSENGEDSWLSWRELINRTSKMSEADSITIDPHKLGYIPYPAGTVLLRSASAREVVSCDAPYLWLQNTQGSDPEFVGRFTLEGSRPGATAAACWLAHSAIPLDQSGHGRILALSILATRKLYQTLKEDLSNKVALLHSPHTNMICYVPYHTDTYTLETMRGLTDSLIKGKLSSTAPDRGFMAVSTDVSLPTEWIRKNTRFGEMLKDIDSGKEWTEIKVIRSVIMAPYSLKAQTRSTRDSELVGIFEAYAEHLGTIIPEATPQLIQELAEKKIAKAKFMVMDDDTEVPARLEGVLLPLRPREWQPCETVNAALNIIKECEEPLHIVFLDIDMSSAEDGDRNSGYTAYESILERNRKVETCGGYRVDCVIFFTSGAEQHDNRIGELDEQYPGHEPRSVQTILKTDFGENTPPLVRSRTKGKITREIANLDITE